jgi:hypothetical protein
MLIFGLIMNHYFPTIFYSVASIFRYPNVSLIDSVIIIRSMKYQWNNTEIDQVLKMYAGKTHSQNHLKPKKAGGQFQFSDKLIKRNNAL